MTSYRHREQCTNVVRPACARRRPRSWFSVTVATCIVHPNSLAAGFDTKKRQEFQAWLKDIDKDQGAVERGLRGMM